MRVCLDAGHYGKYNQSPCIGKYYESDMVWTLHLLLKKELEKYGIEVITTRGNQETDLPLTSRGKMSKGCDLFLSLHSNAVGSGINENVDYPVSYVPINHSADEIGLLLAQCVERVMGTKQSARINSRTGSSGQDYYGVLRGAVSVGTVGVILEHSFHTNTSATKWLLDDSNLSKLAKAEADVIAKYFGVEEEDTVVRYERLKDIPNNWDREGNPRATIEKLMNAGILNGDGSDRTGNDDIIDLSHDMVRTIILEYRGGAFDKALIAAGFEPAVE